VIFPFPPVDPSDPEVQAALLRQKEAQETAEM
jgi:hypothetical protein